MNQREITQAVTTLHRGGLVAFPTETVYGLGADATNAAAIERVFRVKKRPFNHPLIVHLAQMEQWVDWALCIPAAAWQLAHAFWPGPLTIVLRKQPQVLAQVTGGQPTVALRVPAHPVAQALLQAFGKGIVAPSANQFTHISPTTAAAVQEELGGQIELILDGGRCQMGLESTIIDVTGTMPTLLRPGLITTGQIEAVLGCQVAMAQGTTRVPGMHALHYAPVTQTMLMTKKEIDLLLLALPPSGSIAILTHSMMIPCTKQVDLIRMPASAVAYARDLYHTLRELDRQPFQFIVIETVPQQPEWQAIQDRLLKASGSRR